MHGRNFTQTGGSITGPLQMYFYGTTKMSGGTIGVVGATTDTVKIYDITRTNAPNILDIQTGGTQNPNFIYNAWGVPDSTRSYLLGCDFEVMQDIPLAITWNYFYVTLVDKTPFLQWSADCDLGTIFEIQRSYDGMNFSLIKGMPYDYGKTNYNFNDRSVNTSAPIVYYRIKATELSRDEKYTSTRVVRFTNRPGLAITTFPNPFTSDFIINFRALEKGMITIRMFNTNGQQQLAKNIATNSGMNIIAVTEAAQLPDGMYIIQVIDGNKKISSNKIMKQ